MKHFFVALQFLTRLKLVNQTNWTVEDFGRSVPYFPLIGIVVGASSALFYGLLLPFFGPQVTSLMTIVFQFLFTGGLHADGYMDTCDGLFSGRERERKLEIMKDSRVGANGVTGFLFLILLKWQFLASIVLPWQALTLVLIYPILSKYGLTQSIRLFPYARPEGMGKAFAKDSPSNTLFVSTVIALLPVLYFGFLYVLLFVVALASNQIINRYCTKHLGGVTGDTYGFTSECTELIVMFGFCAYISSMYFFN